MPSTMAASTTWPSPPPDLEQRGDDPEREEQSPAAEVGDQVQRRRRRTARPVRCAAERAGDGDVVDVVPGARRQRALLAPAGHPAVDERRVAGEAVLRPDAEPLGDAGTEALDEDVGPADQVEHERRRRPGP